MKRLITVVCGLCAVAIITTAHAQPDAARVAFRALQGLGAVVEGGTTYREYVSRLNDARIATAPALKASGGSTALREALGGAMGYYGIAAQLWSFSITNGQPYWIHADVLEPVGKLPCARLQKIDEVNGQGVAPILAALWLCASDDAAKAEKLLVGAKR